MRRHLVTAIALALAGTGATATAFALPAAPQAAAAPAAAAPVVADATTQLPRDIEPTHYEIAVVPHADKLTFDGRVAIDLQVLEPTADIVLNQIDMTFPQAVLASKGGKPMKAKVAVDNDAQTATFSFDKPLAKGEYTLTLDYTGKIGTQANGLFAIDYDTDSGKKRALYTQFENSDARRFVPSWDEPNHKATFTLTATVPASQMAVSNMPAAETVDMGNGLKRVRFQQSPKMSTYLLFFGLGDFDRATTMADGVEIGVVTQKGKADQAKFSLESAAAVIKEYNDYFGVPYPLPKLDNIASPGSSQFFSAMENWGAIYTFEYAQLFDPRISTESTKEGIFSTGAHEIAHQWFGDLVTMAWWDDLWLNEGFASWMEGRTTAKLHPEWNSALSAVGVREAAMNRDAIATTHPVVQHVETVEQASQAFDSITYSKGESVIRMLEAYVGADTWRDGVRKYIKAHAYGNAVSDDLWQAVDSVSDKPITQIAHDFTLQPGIPLIKVESAQCAGGNTTVQLSQGEFTRDRPDKQPLSWHVPVVAATVGGSAPARTVVDGKATLEVPGCGTLVVNAGQAGYFRTLYPQAQIAQLRGGFGKLATIDQLGLMNDIWALGMAGNEPLTDYLDLAAAVPADAAPEVWQDVVGSLSSIDYYYEGSPEQAAFRKYALATLQPVFARVGWEAKPGEADPVRRLRSSLIGALAGLDDQAVIAEARRRYAAGGDAVPVVLRNVILGIVAHNADAATWDKMHADAEAETTPLIKDQLYGLLAIAKDDALAQRALDLALTDEPGATNSAGMIARVAGEHPDMAFDFAVAHREKVDKLVDSTSRSRYYPGIGGGSRDPKMIDKLNAFADAYIAKSSRRATDTAIAGIQYRREVIEKRLPQVTAWLAKRKK
jgi:aminopeptidase N